MDAATRTIAPGAPMPRRGVMVFAQPFVVLWVAIWLLNDHVLKDRYASWWTGKLSDVAGLIVFPLILAALIERRSSRPIEWAIAATVAFYGSINVVPLADSVTEAIIGAFMGPVTLTMDPTDLLVLPAVAGAAWAWSTAPQTKLGRTKLRRSWGRVVFATAIATTVATSPVITQSETITGTVLLTDDAPSISMPITLTLDGDGSEDFDPLHTQVAVVPYGEVPGDTSEPVVGSVNFIEAGAGVFELARADGVTGPIEVRWSVYAETEGGGLFGGEPPEPVVSVDAPADTFGPLPVLQDALQISGPELAPAHRLTVEAGPGSVIRMVTLRPVSVNSVRVANEDTWGWLGVASPVDLARPARCEEAPDEMCQFDVYVGAAERWAPIELVVLALEGEPSVIKQGRVEMMSHTVTGTTPSYRFNSPNERLLQVGLSYDAIDDPLDAPMTFLELIIDRQTSDADDVFVNYWVNELDFADGCCEDIRLTSQHSGNGRDDDEAFDDPVDVVVTWTATLWTPADIDPASVTVTIE